jgi:hypothetical protein
MASTTTATATAHNDSIFPTHPITAMVPPFITHKDVYLEASRRTR